MRGLTKLWAVGLATAIEDTSKSEVTTRSQEILTPKLLESFTERIAADLDADPLELDHEAHRMRLAELLSDLGQMNYYELLGIELKADHQEVFAAYRQLGRLVHPRHAPELDLEDKDVAVRVLFERATEAYLTLSDPKRRASYNMMAGIHRDVQIDAEQREQEKRVIARQNYRRAAICMAEMDYSLAVDLLKEAARIDPPARVLRSPGSGAGQEPELADPRRRQLPQGSGAQVGQRRHPDQLRFAARGNGAL